MLGGLIALRDRVQICQDAFMQKSPILVEGSIGGFRLRHSRCDQCEDDEKLIDLSNFSRLSCKNFKCGHRGRDTLKVIELARQTNQRT